MKSIAVIGAGIAGITLARQLQDCADVHVFEKSRGFGGRMATRRSDAFSHDHGAQYFTARSKQFRAFADDCTANNQIQQWQPRVLTLNPEKKPYKREWFEPHYVAIPGMNSLCRNLATELRVSLASEVSNIDKSQRGWQLKDASGDLLGEFDWVACTSPAPQAGDLLPECFAHKEELSKVEFSPCFALMLGLTSKPKFNFDACLVRNSSIGWIALDSSKPARGSSYSLVVHSDNAWAENQIDNSIDDVRRMMLEELGRLLGGSLPEAEHIAMHRWKYAKAEISCEESFLLDRASQLAACGDWCGGNRVEDAYLSATELGKVLRRILRRDA